MIVVEVVLNDRLLGKHCLVAAPSVGDRMHVSDKDGAGTIAVVTAVSHFAVRLDGLGYNGEPLLTISAVEIE